MNFYVLLLFSASVFIAGITGLIRFRKIEPSYYPFLFFIWIGCINELITILLIMKGKSNYINNNIYVLSAALLILWFFKKNGTFAKTKMLFYTLLTILLALWVAESFFIKDIVKEISSYFRIVSSFIIILLSISTINSILIDVSGRIIKNPMFLISLAFLFYFTYKVLIEAFWIYGLESSENFRILVYDILAYINLITNLTYALAVLWIPKKQPSILPL